MFIIPDEVLDQLLCSGCLKYLSVKPVKIYGKGIIKCGRCSKDTDKGVVSLYERIISSGLFPCINRYEGCKQLLSYSEVASHEMLCSSRCYSCPLCLSDDEYSCFHLIHHFKNLHSSEFLVKPEIVVSGEAEYDQYYMYKDNDFVFILNVRCNLAENCFFLNAASLGDPDKVSRIVQYVKCYLGDDKNSERLFFQSKQRGCTSFDNNSESFKINFPKNMTSVKLNFCFDKSGVNIFSYIPNSSISNPLGKSNVKDEIVGLQNEHPKIFLSAEYKEQYTDHHLSSCGTKLLIGGNYNFPRICEFCENIFPVSKTATLFKCGCNHIYCHKCYSLAPYCAKTSFTELKLATFETQVYKLLYFYCRWGCGRFYCGPDLRYHEDHCKDNTDAQDSLSVMAMKHFSFYLSNAKTHFVSRSNIFSFKDYNFVNSQKVFVITRDYFKFVLNSSYENKMYHFWVSHDYPSDKCYILFRVRDKYKLDYFRVNTFSIDNTQSNVLGFAVLLRKITE